MGKADSGYMWGRSPEVVSKLGFCREIRHLAQCFIVLMKSFQRSVDSYAALGVPGTDKTYLASQPEGVPRGIASMNASTA
jgi:hypothetical protein